PAGQRTEPSAGAARPDTSGSGIVPAAAAQPVVPETALPGTAAAPVGSAAVPSSAASQAAGEPSPTAAQPEDTVGAELAALVSEPASASDAGPGSTAAS